MQLESIVKRIVVQETLRVGRIVQV